MRVFTAGKLGPVQSQSKFNQFCGDISTIWKRALGDDPIVGNLFFDFGCDHHAFAHLDQRKLGFLAPGMLKLGRIDSGNPDLGAAYHDRVAVDYVALAFESPCGWISRGRLL